MEDLNPQEIVTYLHVGFLDRCATITLIFRIKAPHRCGSRGVQRCKRIDKESDPVSRVEAPAGFEPTAC